MNYKIPILACSLCFSLSINAQNTLKDLAGKATEKILDKAAELVEKNIDATLGNAERFAGLKKDKETENKGSDTIDQPDNQEEVDLKNAWKVTLEEHYDPKWYMAEIRIRDVKSTATDVVIEWNYYNFAAYNKKVELMRNPKTGKLEVVSDREPKVELTQENKAYKMYVSFTFQGEGWTKSGMGTTIKVE